MGGTIRRRAAPRVLLVHWKAEEAPGRLVHLRAAGLDAVHRPLATAPVRELREARPEVVVIDLGRLPSHGLAVALAVRQSPSLRRIPLVFVGGDPTRVARVRARIPDAAYAGWDGAGAAVRRVLEDPPRDPIPATSVMDGYAGRPLAGKLGIREGDRVAMPGAPQDFERTLGDLPPDVQLARDARGATDLVLWFPRDRAECRRRFPRLGDLARRWLWVVWAKRASGVAGDLDPNVVRRIGLAAGFVDSKICAVDATWSGLRFSRRRTAARAETRTPSRRGPGGARG